MKAGTPAGRAASLVVELGTGTAIVGDERIEIPPGEFELLAVLASRAGKAIPSKELLATLWPGDAIATEQDLRGRVYRLRKRLGDDKRSVKVIANRPGFGYLIDLPSEAIEVVGRKSPPLEPAEVVVLDPVPQNQSEGTAQIPATISQTAAPPRPVDARTFRPVVVALTAVGAALLLGGSWLAGSWLSGQVSADTPIAQPDIKENDAGDQAGKRNGKDRRSRQFSDRRARAKVTGERIVRPIAAAPAPATVGDASTSGQQQVESDPKAAGNKPQQQPGEEPAPRPDTRLFHLHHPETGDHFVTTDSSAANQKQASGYAMTMEGWVFRTPIEGTTAITLHGDTAFIYRTSSSAPKGVAVAPLYRLSNGSKFFFTSSSSQANQAEAQGWTRSIAGYVGV